MTMKKTLTESDQITATLISKARKAKGVAQWAKLEPLKEKLDGKQQGHIQFTSYNPKAYGKKRTLASKEGALDFLMGYVSPQFFIAPYHLQIINPSLTDEKAKEWLLKMGHPSKVSPTADKAEGPEGDIEQGWCHDSVAHLYPGKQFALANKVSNGQSEEADAEAGGGSKAAGKADAEAGGSSPPAAGTDAAVGGSESEADHPVEPAFVEGHDQHAEEAPGKPSDLLLACPFGGGSRCRNQGGSGSPYHHINSDSMRAHILKIAEGTGNMPVPKMGSFKGEPALFFQHNGAPYVAVPTRQEVHAKNGAVYKWSFLAEGPLAGSNPLLARVMNQMAPRKPVIIPLFDIAESVVTIAHDVVPSEDPMECMFAPEVYQLIKDFFPRPGSVIQLGIIKGEKVFAVVTERSLDFYNESGEDTFFPAADGMYYAYFDLTGKETPAIVLLSFINLFLTHIDTTPLEQQLQQEEDTKSEILYGSPTEGYEDVPADAPATAVSSGGSFVASDDPNPKFGKVALELGLQYQQVVQKWDLTAVSKPDNWNAYDMPPFLGWKFTYENQEYLLTQNSFDVVGGKTKTGQVSPSYLLFHSGGGLLEGGPSLIEVVQNALSLEGEEPEILEAIGLIHQAFPPGCTALTIVSGSDEIIPSDSPLCASLEPVY